MTILIVSPLAFAVQMKDDPNGFEGIPWGAALSESETFREVDTGGRQKTFELKSVPLTLGSVNVESMRFVTVDDKFARVIVRYHGKVAHDQMLEFLQSRYGPLDRTPGQIAIGPARFHAWQGFETEVTLRYETRNDQGIIFFESQTLRSTILEGSLLTAP
ncbi:hypothetical protein [Nitrospira sp. KM1]|uniref:hypothetical protein n=1 Tax=Nitrospira sp. KM1 TaxID=1936990 RepID=UPI0015644C8C|nr:hypothetical protein [Nitrospira sp. KM1]